MRQALGIVPRREAFVRVHHPDEEAEERVLNRARDPGHLRLILEEFFLFELGLAARRRALRGTRKGIAFAIGSNTRELVKKILPFPLTGAQKRVLREIADDMRSPHPMNRLVQGDVGSGKTLVGLLAMIVAVENGYQAAFMAPTEILAEQHFLTFRRLLGRTSCRVDARHFGPQGQGARGGARGAGLGGDADRGGDPRPHPGAAWPSAAWAWPWWTSSTASASSSARICARRGTAPTCS